MEEIPDSVQNRLVMRRVLIIGCAGAGKTTFAKKLAAKTGLPLVHLDQLYWRPGWEEPPLEKWFAILGRELERDAWILDGHMGNSIELRLRAADTVIWLDYPRWICLRRVAWRVLNGFGRVRKDMGAGCPERIDLEFLRFIWRFRRERGHEVQEALADFSGQLIVLKKPGDAKRFLQELQSRTVGAVLLSLMLQREGSWPL
jgi:adenylate kinase family enzyme